ncbi:LA_2272 family surface repeat-containing protein [Persicobacter psychrovividus]
MKQILVLTISLCISFSVKGQKAQTPKVKNIFWVQPNNVSKINGVALGPFNSSSWSDHDHLMVNGLNIELIGNGLWGYFLPHPSFPETNYNTVNGISLSPTYFGGTNNGITLSALTIMSNMNGLNLGLLSRVNNMSSGINFGFMMVKSEKMKGAQIGFFTNARDGKGLFLGGIAMSNKMKGVQIGIFNHVQKGNGLFIGGFECSADTLNGVSVSMVNLTDSTHKGLQIGLFNYANSLNGTQIGLINYAKDAKIPFTLFFNRNRKKKKALINRGSDNVTSLP